MQRTAAPTWGISSKLLKHWYLTVTQAIVLYGSGIWAKHLTVQERRLLNSLQRPHLLQISRGYRTTSTAALQVLTGIPPLDLVAEREAAISNTLRLGKDYKLWNRNLHTSEYMHKIFDYPCHPAQHNLAENIYTQTLLCRQNSIAIYTDGSKTKDGTGCGLCTMIDGEIKYRWKRRLNPNNTVYQAELSAIKKAIDLSYSHQETVYIYSDSLSSIAAIEGPASRDPFVLNIQRALVNLPLNYRPIISWVPAHTGVVGNELADEQAKQAASGIFLPEHALPLPSSYLKKITRGDLYAEWQQRWDTSRTGRRTYKFIPKVTDLVFSNSSSLTTFLSGHGPFPDYLHRFGLRDYDLCECGLIGTPDHYAFTCRLTEAHHMRPPSDRYWREWTKVLLERRGACFKLHKIIKFCRVHFSFVT
ncbi:uncharacterized protein LOC118203694 [Stegodyphus dumicola]|uniref:uncharacterized protein LOC118203694 n=3 Tax=Stegodyphus dumicola TaxID=202533 RepID=UPI0015B14A41|nr:uncharacterized protein LOC118203694 [Stegodyphus dumicola]